MSGAFGLPYNEGTMWASQNANIPDAIDPRLEECLKALEQTKAEPTPRALEIGRRGLELWQLAAETEIDRWVYSYFNLAEPCYLLVRELQRLDRLDALAIYAKLERAPEGALFAYEIPPIKVSPIGAALDASDGYYSPPAAHRVATWHLAAVLGVSHEVAYARLVLWLAVAHTPAEFGQDELFSQQLHFLPAYIDNPSRQPRSVNRVHTGLCGVARRIARHKLELVSGARAGAKQNGPALVVSVEKLTATLNGRPFDLKGEQQARWLKVLADHPGMWISARELKNYDNELDGARTDRLRVGLPKPIARMVDTDKHKGARLRS